MGSLVFLGGTGLEPMAVRLIEQVRSQGVAAHKVQLELFLARLYVYLEYLSDV